MQLQECLSEACGEGRCRLSNTTFCTSQFCCETRQEVVFGLFRSQNGYRRKYAECICGQEDYVLSCRSCGYRTNDVLDVVDRVGYTSILGNALICKVDLAIFSYSNVLKQSVTFDCIVDVRLRLFVKVDNFCVASALEVNTPLSSQPCSSSPIRRRFGSVESVVLPGPERPKKFAVFSPFISVFAEQ